LWLIECNSSSNMDINVSNFFALANQNPWAYLALILNFGVVFINGWTDAPNCIATCVTTRCLEPKKAIFMAAMGNLIGTLLIGFLCIYLSTGDVSSTIAGIVNLSSFTLDRQLIAISFGLLANILFSLLCTKFGFPSSQSNALVGGLTGGAMALAAISGNANLFAYVGSDAWIKVLIGFFGSIVLGFFLGYGLVYLIQFLFRHAKRGEATRFFSKGQIVASGLMSIAHGIQDGAKFIGVNIIIASMLFLHADSTLSSADAIQKLLAQWWIVVPVSLVITCGTLVGGKNIIKTMGSGMANLNKDLGFATDIAAFIGLILATVFGLPVSTGSVKATAIMGSGASRSFRRVHWNKAGEMVLSWILIFPGTAIIAFVLTLIFAAIFK
jgi:PiT family inorganic phosphate transporter